MFQVWKKQRMNAWYFLVKLSWAEGQVSFSDLNLSDTCWWCFCWHHFCRCCLLTFHQFFFLSRTTESICKLHSNLNWHKASLGERKKLVQMTFQIKNNKKNIKMKILIKIEVLFRYTELFWNFSSTELRISNWPLSKI